jgi:hypothetical protein
MKVYIVEEYYTGDIVGVSKSLKGVHALVKKIIKGWGSDYEGKIKFTKRECNKPVVGAYIFNSCNKVEEVVFIIEQFGVKA